MPVSSDIASVPTPSVGTEVVIRVDGVQGVEVLMFRFVFIRSGYRSYTQNNSNKK